MLHGDGVKGLSVLGTTGGEVYPLYLQQRSCQVTKEIIPHGGRHTHRVCMQNPDEQFSFLIPPNTSHESPLLLSPCFTNLL
jgi:hypothetical protein